MDMAHIRPDTIREFSGKINTVLTLNREVISKES